MIRSIINYLLYSYKILLGVLAIVLLLSIVGKMDMQDEEELDAHVKTVYVAPIIDQAREQSLVYQSYIDWGKQFTPPVNFKEMK